MAGKQGAEERAPRYSVVVPVYRSAGTLRELHQRTVAALDGLEGGFEMILVEDCGGDGSWEVMQELRSKDSRVRIVRLARNFGQHNALLCGFTLARGEYVITFDDDLQNPPEEIPALIRCICSGELDVVNGIPRERQHSLVRNVGSLVHNMVLSSGAGGKGVTMSSFRIIRKPIVEVLLRMQGPNPAIGLMLLRVTARIGSLEVGHHERREGRSTYTLRKLVRLFSFGLLYHSDLPLKGIFFLGLGSLALSMALGLYYLVLSLAGTITVSGFTTLVLLILFFSGTVMLSLGVLGEFVRRILQEVRGTPPYVIKDLDV